MTNDEQAMRAVIESMGEAAKAAKRAKYTRKPAPVEAAPAEAPDDGGMPTAGELEAMLNGG